MSGLQLLTEKYIAKLKELEAESKNVKHKLDIVVEASRLLEEEGLPEGYPASFGDREPFPYKA
jgi:hypothetical protein